MKWLPKVLASAVLWMIVFLMVIFVDPDLISNILFSKSYLPMAIAIFMAVFYSCLVISKNYVVSVVISAVVISGFYLAVHSIMNWYTFVVSIVIIVTSMYFAVKKRK